MRDRLHGVDVDGGDAADRVLHDDVEHALTVADALFGCAAEVDGAEHGAVFGIDDGCVLGGMAEDVDALVEGVEVDAVGPCLADVDALDERHGLGIEHRDLGMIAGEAVIGLWIDGSAVASDAGDFAERL